MRVGEKISDFFVGSKYNETLEVKLKDNKIETINPSDSLKSKIQRLSSLLHGVRDTLNEGQARDINLYAESSGRVVGYLQRLYDSEGIFGKVALKILGFSRLKDEYERISQMGENDSKPTVAKETGGGKGRTPLPAVRANDAVVRDYPDTEINLDEQQEQVEQSPIEPPARGRRAPPRLNANDNTTRGYGDHVPPQRNRDDTPTS